LLFSVVISQHFSKNRMIICVVAAKIWYLKKYTVFIGPPCILVGCVDKDDWRLRLKGATG